MSLTSSQTPLQSRMKASRPSPKTGRKLGKRACDSCKIRKIKCSEQPPCDGCRAVGLACTFNKRPATRGPRKLRTSTLQEIAKAQQQKDTPEDEGSAAVESSNGRIPVVSLVLQLCIYRLRMYSVWPVVKVEEIIAALQSSTEDLETYALANAIGAATMAQLKLAESSGGADTVSGARMEEECQRARNSTDATRQANLTTLRTAFFLHIYHENKSPGGVNSLLYLRETLTLAQMLRLDREASYQKLPMDEQQIRRRILWLLFITERGVSMLHKLPVVLRPNIAFPSTSADEEAIFPAFQKLVNLFWIFDQSHAFEILQEKDVDVFRIGGAEATNTNQLDKLQGQLQDIPIIDDSNNVNDIQTADIAVTRQWMRAVLWRASKNRALVAPTSDAVTFCSHPFQIAKDFLEVTSKIPSSAFEAHGLCAELKIFEIATSVTDAISYAANVISWASMNRPRELLNRLHHILASTRGGNQNLVTMLRGKIAQVTSAAPVQVLVEPGCIVEEEGDNEDTWVDAHDPSQLGLLSDFPDSFEMQPAMMPIQNTRSFSDSDLPNLTFEHRDSTGTTLSEPAIHNASIPLQTQSQQLPQLVPFDWDISQQAMMMNGNNDTFTPGYGNGVYGQLQASDIDTFGAVDVTRFTSNNEWWDDGVINGVLDIMPEHSGVAGWQ